MDEGPRGPDECGGLESTAVLLMLAREGDQRAANRLLARYRPLLKAIAHGRLPYYLRDMKDTEDLVQITLVRAFNNLSRFQYLREGAFLRYLRKILLNEIRQEIRIKKRKNLKGATEPLHDGHVDPGKTPGRIVIERLRRERFELALGKLKRRPGEAVIMRIDFGLSYEEIAKDLGLPSPGAARMLVARALAKIARDMGAYRETGPRSDE